MDEHLPEGWVAIDLGTNTFRMVGRGLHMIEYVRLGQGVDRSRRIRPEASRRAIAALKKFRRAVTRGKLRVAAVVGTSALRDAANRREFCDAVKRQVGWQVSIIPGRIEAALTFQGALSALTLDARKLVLVSDVGGGSTELVWGYPAARNRPARLLGLASLPLGSVRLMEQLNLAGRVTPAGIARARRRIESLVRRVRIPWQKIHSVVGVGGTATTLAAIYEGLESYDAARVQGLRVPLASIQKMLDVMCAMTPRERRILPCVTKGRADIVVAGTAIQERVVALAGKPDMIASDTGILTGILSQVRT